MPNENSGVDILIPYHGNYTAVRQLLGSIILYTRDIPFRVILIDDGSPNIDFFNTITRIDSQVDGIRLEKRNGFGAAINAGLKHVKRPWVLLLNSNCIVEEMSWLSELWKCLQTGMKDKIMLVSSVMNYGSYAKFLERDRFKREGKELISEAPIPLICCLCPRKLFDRVGLLKEYELAYEDEEFYWRLRRYNYKQAICEKSWIYHGISEFQIDTHGYDLSADNMESLMEKNRQQCIQDLRKNK